MPSHQKTSAPPAAGRGRPKGSKNRRPLAIADMYRRALDLCGDHIAKSGQLKKAGFDPELNGGLAYLVSMGVSEDAAERRMFQQGLLKLMPAEVAATHEVTLSESLEHLLEQNYRLDEDVIDIGPVERPELEEEA